MVKATRVQQAECKSEPSSDLSPNWKDMRSEFGYVMLYAIPPYSPRKIIYKHDSSLNYERWLT